MAPESRVLTLVAAVSATKPRMERFTVLRAYEDTRELVSILRVAGWSVTQTLG